MRVPDEEALPALSGRGRGLIPVSAVREKVEQRKARLETRGHETLLKDLNSRNGTYFRIKTEVPLSNGDYVFIGRQLLRVEFL